MDRDDGLHRAEVVLEAGQPAHVRGAEGPLADRRDDRDGNEIGRPERGCELRRLLAGSIGGQEGTVVALRDAAERRQELRHREARDQPGRDDDPAEFDGERADSPEYGVDAHRVSLPGLMPSPEAGRWGSGSHAGRRSSSEMTVRYYTGYLEVDFSKSPDRSLIIRMAPSGALPLEARREASKSVPRR